jgi:hypothetical protein
MEVAIFGQMKSTLYLLAVRILSESSMIRLDKAGKTAGLQLSKTLDISSRNRKPWKGWE